MSKDISQILDGWNYEPDEVLVRIVQGDDGQEKIQLRLDLGLLQMCVDGRPDGDRPEGCESWLDYYQREASGDGTRFQLDDNDCGRLLREGVQYYHRYLSFWHLKRYELCARDTARNLKLFGFVRKYAPSERSKLQFDQWRPYVIMMHARAVATPLIEMRDYGGALPAIDSGIRAIGKFLEDYNQLERADQCGELNMLKKWRGEVAAMLDESAPKSARTSIQLLHMRLDEAVADERFEEAAKLRDEIRRLSEQPTAPPLE
ncbi:MAG: UvrB/UvrC motif-containing protein [Pirellulales bacterium]|nr:UvrB/UvrC motif-containing protein [Pirellulales bacterium]